MHQKAKIKRAMQSDEVEAEETETAIAAIKTVKLKMGQTHSLSQQRLQTMAQKKKVRAAAIETTVAGIETIVISAVKEKM
jgi:hypothetical protein